MQVDLVQALEVLIISEVIEILQAWSYVRRGSLLPHDRTTIIFETRNLLALRSIQKKLLESCFSYVTAVSPVCQMTCLRVSRTEL